MLASAESRRLKAVRALTEYRALLARHLVATGNVTESDGAKAESPAGGRVTNNVLALGIDARIRARLTAPNNGQLTQNRCELPQCGKEHRPAREVAKDRTRRNAERHGLAARIVFDADRAVRIETLAREIAGAVSDYTSIASARVIARAEFDLQQIRHIKVGLVSAAASPATTSKRRTSHRTAAIARVLPELLKIERYERQAASRRDRAVRDLVNVNDGLSRQIRRAKRRLCRTNPNFGRTNPNS